MFSMRILGLILMGFIYGVAYIIIVAASAIWLNGLGQNVPICIILLYTSLVAVVLFNLFDVRNLTDNYKKIIRARSNWLSMSLSLVPLWYFTYYATIHGSAEFYVAIFFLTTCFIAVFKEKNIIKMMTCLISISLIYYFSKDTTLFALFSALFAGTAGYIYYLSSLRFSQKTKASALAVLSIRFYFVLVFALIYIVISGNIQHLEISTEEAFVLVIFSIVNTVIPPFLSWQSH